jgi:SAM-dependent methyltransferase
VASLSASFTPQHYDRLGPLWLDAFAADLAQRLPEHPPGDVLEIACGTGPVTRRLRERLSPSLRLVATDLSKPMVDYARAKLDGQDIEWREADFLKLPFEDNRFGAVVCGFGIMFAPDRQAAFRETRRVLAAGGIFLFNVWDSIEQNPHALANAQVLEAMFPGDPEMQFPTPYDMHDPGLLRRLLAGARFRETRIETRRIPVKGADPRGIATAQIRGTPRSALIESRGVSLDLAIEKVTDALARTGGNPYSGQAQAVVVQAVAN